MNKLLIILIGMLIVLGCIWYFKSSAPAERHSDAVYDETLGQWWSTSNLTDVSVDKNWILDPEIPINYVPVIGEEEVYMVLNEDGTVNRYRKRMKNGDMWIWEDLIEEDEPVSFKPTALTDVYAYKSDEDDTEKLYQYFRNEDGSYAYVEVDSNGNLIGYDRPNGNNIPSNFVSVDGNNIYAAIDEHGVIIQFWERKIDDMGAVTWVQIANPYAVSFSSGSSYNWGDGFRPSSGGGIGGGIGDTSLPNADLPQLDLTDGQTTSTETFRETETVGGWKITYETVYTYVYNRDGSLYSTLKDGPNEVERVQVFSQQTDLERDHGAIEPTIDAEVNRVSAKLTYQDNIAANVLAGLNAERANNGLNTLNSNQNGNATKLARIFAADMAKYNYADVESPLYGSIEDLANRYGITEPVAINAWRCGEKTAEEISTRFQTAETTRAVRMDSGATSVGIAIVSSNGFFYIAEVLMA